MGKPPEIIAGLDEAGRGPWAGPVVAAAVILPPRIRLPNLNDSKKLTEAQRETLYTKITQRADWGVGWATHQEIDHFGLIRATNKAFRRALNQLSASPDHLLIDGRDRFQLPYSYTSIIKGDEKIRCISAASVIAKVTRDRMMTDYAQIYPEYHFEQHKGYGTHLHQLMLQAHGITPIHRLSYRPIQLIHSLSQ